MIRRISALAAVALLTVSCTGGPTINDGTVVAIKITPDNPQVSAGDDLAFVATAIQVNGVARVVTELPGTTWASSDSSIVQINADGTGHANAEGDAYVTASRDGLTSPPQHVTVVTPPASPSPTPTPTPAPPANHMVISEVMFHPSTGQGGTSGEYVEVHNPTAAPINVASWTILSVHDGTAFTFPVGSIVTAGGFALVCHTASVCQTGFGVTTPYTGLPGLVDSGDWLKLRTAVGATTDEMAYAAGATGVGTPVGWCAFAKPTANTGESVARVPADSDGDNCNDWASAAAPSPLLP